MIRVKPDQGRLIELKKTKFSKFLSCFLFQIPCSVSKSCLTLASLSFTISQNLLKLILSQSSDAIQPSCPLSSPSPAFNLSQHQGGSQSALHIRWPYWSFSFSISPPNEYSGLIQVPPGKDLSIPKMAIFSNIQKRYPRQHPS